MNSNDEICKTVKNQSIMKNKVTLTLVILTASFLVTSCSVIEGIFKVGFGAGIFISILVVALIIYLISRFLKK